MKIKSCMLAIGLMFGSTMALNANTPAVPAPAPTTAAAVASAPIAAAPQHHGKDHKKGNHKADFPCNDWCTAAVCKGHKNVINVCKAKGNKCSNLPAECQKHNKKDKPDASAFNCEKLCTESACHGRPNAISACEANCKGKNIPQACVGKLQRLKNKIQEKKDKLNHKVNEVKGIGHELKESAKSIVSSK